jgi:hypothetical protein
MRKRMNIWTKIASVFSVIAALAVFAVVFSREGIWPGLCWALFAVVAIWANYSVRRLVWNVLGRRSEAREGREA